MTTRFAVDPGLCRTCRHARTVTSHRGSGFLLCGLSARDPAFPRYPRLPVLACPGYDPEPPSEGPDAPARVQ